MDPTTEFVDQIAQSYPDNPFLTSEYCQVRKNLGQVPVAFTIHENDRSVTACIGFLSRGRLNTRLEIVSLPKLEDKELFWSSLFKECSRLSVTSLDVNTFASVSADFPDSPAALTRHSRVEFSIDLRTPDLWANLNRRHRRMVNRAREAGLELKEPSGSAAIEAHVDLANISLSRLRKKGDNIDSEISIREIELFQEFGAGTLYQVFRDADLMGTLFVVKSTSGAYAQSSGSSDQGRELGASHFLFFETARRLQAEEKNVFNIGGVGDRRSGLSEFKQGFGARATELEAAEYYLGGLLRRLLTKSKGLLWRS